MKAVTACCLQVLLRSARRGAVLGQRSDPDRRCPEALNVGQLFLDSLNVAAPVFAELFVGVASRREAINGIDRTGK